MVILLILFLLVIIVCLLYRTMDKAYERQIAAYQNKLLKNQVDEVHNMYLTMRGWRHDYHNHMQSVKAYLAMDSLDEARAYLDRLEQDLDDIDLLFHTGNINADARRGVHHDKARQPWAWTKAHQQYRGQIRRLYQPQERAGRLCDGDHAADMIPYIHQTIQVQIFTVCAFFCAKKGENGRMVAAEQIGEKKGREQIMKQHSLWSNYRYTYGPLWQKKKKIVLSTIAEAVFYVFVPIVGMMTTSMIIGSLEQGISMSKLVLLVLAAFAVCGVLNIAKGYLEARRRAVHRGEDRTVHHGSDREGSDSQHGAV